MSLVSAIGKKAISSVAGNAVAKVARVTKPQGIKSNLVKAAEKSSADVVEVVSAEFNARRFALLDIFRKRGAEDETINSILKNAKPETIDFFEKIITNPKTDIERLKLLSASVTKDNQKAVADIILDKNLKLNPDKVQSVYTYAITEENAGIFKKLLNNDNVSFSDLMDVLKFTQNPEVAKAVKNIVSHNGINVNHNLWSFSYKLSQLTPGSESFNLQIKFINDICKNKNLKIDNLWNLNNFLDDITKDNYDFGVKLMALRPDLKSAEEILCRYGKESESFYNKFINYAPQNYDCRNLPTRDLKLAEQYIDGLKNITSDADKTRLLDILDDLNGEQDVKNIIKLINENPDKIKQITTKVIASDFRPECADRIVKTIDESGRELIKQEVEYFSLYYPKTEATENAVKKLLNNRNIDTRDVIDIERDLIERTVRSFMDEKAKMLEKLLDNKKLSAEDIKLLYGRANNSTDAQRIIKYMDNPKFVKGIGALKAKTDEELEFLLNSKVLKPENYAEYISAVHRDCRSPKEISKIWKLLEHLTGKYPDESQNIMSIIYNINSKNKKFTSAMLKRNMQPNDVRMILQSYFSDVRNITESEMEFFTNLVKDKQICNEGVKNIFSSWFKHDYKELSKLYAKYPVTLRKAVNSGIKIENISDFQDLIKNKNFDSILEQLKNLKKQHNVHIDYPMEVLGKHGNSNDLYLSLKSYDNKILKFDKRTGKLVTISEDKLSLNLKNGVRSSSFALWETKDGLIDAPYYMESYLEKPGKTPVKQIYTESTMPGQFEIFSQSPSGKKTKIGIVKEFPSGAKYVKRHLRALDGSLSEFSHKTDANGNRFLQSVIRDKNGKIISQTTKTFKKLSDNHFISTVNGQSYDIEFFSDRVVTTKLDAAGRKTAEFVEYKIADMPDDLCQKTLDKLEQLGNAQTKKPEDLEKFMKESYEKIFAEHGIDPYTIDRKTVDLMKNMSGDEWFAMRKSCPYVVGNNYEANNACFAGGPIFMSKELRSNYGVFSHELGHAKFQALGLDKDKELMRIYNEEKRRFTQMFPESDIESISYFMEGNAVDMRGINEGSAETNLINNTLQSWSPIQDRTIIWEQYFPNTRAYIEKKFAALV